jgi:8-oxo-dGTP pyrophosphatase MutT (NUDIX family)
MYFRIVRLNFRLGRPRRRFGAIILFVPSVSRDPALTKPSQNQAPGKGNVQFAALPWRRLGDGSVKVLVITSRETRRWVIPKGWPMPGLSPDQAAAQEAYEEAGVAGDQSPEPIGAYSYDKRLPRGAAQAVKVLVFAMEVLVEQLAFPEHGQRDKLWTSPAEAAERVDEPELKALIGAFKP